MGGSISLVRQVGVQCFAGLRNYSHLYTAPEDFLNTVAVLSFNQETSRACTNIPIEDDNFTEDPEDFPIILVPDGEDPEDPDNPMTTVTIIDDDEVTIGFEMEMYTAMEDQETVEVCARILEGRLSASLSVAVSLASGDLTAQGMLWIND